MLTLKNLFRRGELHFYRVITRIQASNIKRLFETYVWFCHLSRKPPRKSTIVNVFESKISLYFYATKQ